MHLSSEHHKGKPHVVSVEDAAGGELALNRATNGGVDKEVVIGAKVCGADTAIGERCRFA